ncbi:MAG: ribosome biogenesis GTPase Der [Deltaproteobacteria bacterium]
MRPIVAIVGRPNVGKSTLFNRILGRKKAIVHDEPGVTRDLNFADMEEFGRPFTLVDTGGFETVTKDEILQQVRDQARLAIEDADVIVFVMDGRTGPTGEDRELVQMIRKSGKNVVYVANKIDSEMLASCVAEFYSMGIKDVLGVSAEHGKGVNELIDAIMERLPEAQPVPEDTDRIKVAILGRPNAGKSSLLNRIIGRPRAIVSAVAGTTRDAVDTPYDTQTGRYLFIDTAGIRKKSKISLTVETYSVMEAIRSIDKCDVAILVIDAKDGVKGQDEKIAGLIEDRKKCCILIVNKWDLVEKETSTADHVADALKAKLPFIAYAPVLFTSALTGQRVPKVIEKIDEIFEMSRRRITTSQLNSVFEPIASRHRPGSFKGKEVKFYYITQSAIQPPTFVIFTNIPEGVDDAYKRYLSNSLKEAIGLDDVPIKLFFRPRH